MVTFDVFISADTFSEIARVSARDHISPEEAAAKEKKRITNVQFTADLFQKKMKFKKTPPAVNQILLFR